jgi:hypothetical protein
MLLGIGDISAFKRGSYSNQVEITNGQRASFWFDYWSPLGPLNLISSHNDDQLQCGLSAHITVSAVIPGTSKIGHRTKGLVLHSNN